MREIAAAADEGQVDQEIPDDKVMRIFAVSASEPDATHPADATQL
jgi:hypothetical protein